MRYRRYLRIFTLFIVMAVAACEPQSGSAPAPTAREAPRLVSLAPHLTELVFAAGAGSQLVGAVAYSDYPEAARAVMRVGDAFNLDYEQIARLQPDIVLAWQGGTPATVIERLEKMALRVVKLRTQSLEDVAVSLEQIGELAGDEALARSHASAFRSTLEAERRDVEGAERLRVFYQVSLEPLYTPGAGHFISELIELCGGTNIFADLALQAAAVSHEAVLSRRPQLIVVGQQWLTETREHWQRFASVSPQVVGINADWVSRPGLRLAQGAAALCALFDEARADKGSATSD